MTHSRHISVDSDSTKNGGKEKIELASPSRKDPGSPILMLMTSARESNWKEKNFRDGRAWRGGSDTEDDFVSVQADFSLISYQWSESFIGHPLSNKKSDSANKEKQKLGESYLEQSSGVELNDHHNIETPAHSETKLVELFDDSYWAGEVSTKNETLSLPPRFDSTMNVNLTRSAKDNNSSNLQSEIASVGCLPNLSSRLLGKKRRKPVPVSTHD